MSKAARLVFKEIIIISPAPLADELCGAERARRVQLPLPPRGGLGDGKRDGIALGASPGHSLLVLDPGGERGNPGV